MVYSVLVTGCEPVALVREGRSSVRPFFFFGVGWEAVVLERGGGSKWSASWLDQAAGFGYIFFCQRRCLDLEGF